MPARFKTRCNFSIWFKDKGKRWLISNGKSLGSDRLRPGIDPFVGSDSFLNNKRIDTGLIDEAARENNFSRNSGWRYRRWRWRKNRKRPQRWLLLKVNR